MYCIQINGVDMDGVRHEQAVNMLTSLERYMRLVCEREVVLPRGAPSPVLSTFAKPIPKPLPRKITSTSSVTSDSEPPQVQFLWNCNVIVCTMLGVLLLEPVCALYLLGGCAYQVSIVNVLFQLIFKLFNSLICVLSLFYNLFNK